MVKAATTEISAAGRPGGRAWEHRRSAGSPSDPASVRQQGCWLEATGSPATVPASVCLDSQPVPKGRLLTGSGWEHTGSPAEKTLWLCSVLTPERGRSWALLEEKERADARSWAAAAAEQDSLTSPSACLMQPQRGPENYLSQKAGARRGSSAAVLFGGLRGNRC